MSSHASQVACAALDVIKNLLPDAPFTALHEPVFSEREQDLVLDCVRSGWVSSVGKYVDGFEQQLAQYTGAKHAVATVNGTAALHLAYQLAGITAADEVFCPSLTFIATANALTYLGATPHFVDVDAARLTVCPKKLEEHILLRCDIQGQQLINRTTGRVIRALVVMHSFGHPADMDALLELSKRYHFVIIEDAAESLGSYYKNRHTGLHGLIAALSFNGNKIITTGGGGAILTNNSELATRAKHLSTQAKLLHAYEYVHDATGYNYRMPNINAALGVAQLEKLPDFLARKRSLASAYAAAFAAMQHVRYVEEPADCRSNYWLHSLVFDDASARDMFLEKAVDYGLQARPIWRPMHLLTMYENTPRAPLEATEWLYARLVNIPSSASLVASRCRNT